MILYCLGMVSSGSTWLYNVSREILSAAGVDNVALPLEMTENLLDPRLARARNGVFRAHNIESALLRALSLTDTKVILTLRDPRDALASFLQRFEAFGAKVVPVCNDLTRNLSSIITASEKMTHLALFYEDGFTHQLSSITKIADFIGVTIQDSQAEEIYHRYSADSVRTFISNMTNLGPERIFTDKNNNSMDRDTSFHVTHISDMRTGKWNSILDHATKELISSPLDSYANLIALCRESGDRRGLLDVGDAPCRELVLRFRTDLFGPVDNLDEFTRFLRLDEVVSDLGLRLLDYIYLPAGNWLMTLSVPGLSQFVLTACQDGKVIFTGAADQESISFNWENDLHDQPFNFHIFYDGMEASVEVRGSLPKAELHASRFLDEVSSHRA